MQSDRHSSQTECNRGADAYAQALYGSAERKMTRHERYWNRMAARYASRPIRDNAAYEHTLARVEAWLRPEDRAVEFGCGTGTTSLKLAPVLNRLDAADFSEAMITIAEEKALVAEITNVTFTRADVSDPVAVPGPYDAVLAFNFLQLMPDLGAALTAVAQRLTPGGLFISKSICLGESGFAPTRLLVRCLRATGVLPPLRFLNVEGLERAIVAAGFEIVEAEFHSERPPSRFVVARKVH